MRAFARLMLGLYGLATFGASIAAAADLPTRVGQCSDTRVAKLESRLEGAPKSGSAIGYTNGGYQVSYDMIPAIQRTWVGDPVRLCLVSIPTGCPAGDVRGRIYRSTNLRTGERWQAPDAEHMCGGA